MNILVYIWKIRKKVLVRGHVRYTLCEWLWKKKLANLNDKLCYVKDFKYFMGFLIDQIFILNNNQAWNYDYL